MKLLLSQVHRPEPLPDRAFEKAKQRRVANSAPLPGTHQRLLVIGIAVLGFISLRAAQRVPDPVLVWDAEVKKYEAKRGETNIFVTYHFANISSNAVVISALKATCDCTTARLAADLPWPMPAGPTPNWR
jgi:hypothetical protein